MTSFASFIILALGAMATAVGYLLLVREACLLQRVRQRIDGDGGGGQGSRCRFNRAAARFAVAAARRT